MVFTAPCEEEGPRGGTILRLERSLGPAQLERRNRLLVAAGGLASEGGYRAVTMRDVADRAGLGLATVYRYFASKDHLIAEVHTAAGLVIASELAEHPVGGANGQEGVVRFFELLVESVTRDLNLASAGVMAWSSGDPAATSSEQWHTQAIGPCINAAYGTEDVGDREEIGEILGHLAFSVIVSLTNGSLDSESAVKLLTATVRRTLP